MPSATLDPIFAPVVVSAFSKRHITTIASGALAAAHIPGFFDAPALSGMIAGLRSLPTVDYYPVRVAMTRFGPALNDYRTPEGTLDADRYWPDAEAAARQWRQASMEPDPIQASLEALSEAWGAEIVPATIGGRPAFVGMLREINAGTLLHYDDIHLEYPAGLFDQTVVSQLTFNVYLTVPEQGGETRLWRHRWQATDDVHRRRYGYDPQVVDGCPQVTVRPGGGDALLFNPNHYHTVLPNGEGQRRVAATYFLGITPDGGLIAWS